MPGGVGNQVARGSFKVSFEVLLRWIYAMASASRLPETRLADKNANAGNLMTLLAYCYDLLTDYTAMEPFETETIEAYSKQDLFRRFALDNFSAIHRLIVTKHRVRLSIRHMYENLALRIGTDILSSRLAELRKAKFVAAF